jgi:hypothetical protein
MWSIISSLLSRGTASGKLGNRALPVGTKTGDSELELELEVEEDVFLVGTPPFSKYLDQDS